MDELFEAYGGADVLEDEECTLDSLNQSKEVDKVTEQTQVWIDGMHI